MKFGSKVWVQRGSLNPRLGDPQPGCCRRIKGILVFARGNDRWVRMEEDDPYDTVGWNTKGQVGCWGKSAVTERP